MQQGRAYFISFLFIGLWACQGALFALPENSLVIDGNVDLQLQEHKLLITASDHSIIHWDAFSIGSDERVCFTLPSSQSTILNRVCGENPSTLLGHLSSNGSVYLINPHGILIGKEGVIQTASFIASTLDVSNFDFLEGKSLLFHGDSEQCIENQGMIQTSAGDIILLAQMIKNEGVIEARQGLIALGAGREIVYLPYGDERLQIQLQPTRTENSEITGIHQKGSLLSMHAELKADGNLYGYAIKNEGTIEATGVESRGGHVYLVAEQGYTNHSGLLKGEEVRVLGKYVALVDKAKIDVSSPGGGGIALIGGDYQGQNPGVLNAKVSLVEKGASICADALENGNGGKVIVWGDDITGFYGTISARGGELGGDGGFVEVSGKDLDYQGMTNTLAPQGKNGMLLLDPTDITISDAATDAGIVFGGACGVGIYCNTGVLSPRNIRYGPVGTAGTILANLVLGNVTVASTPGGPAGGNGDITFSATAASGNWTGVNTNTFTLNARRNITFATSYTNSTSAGNFTCMAGLGVLGTITINAGQTVAHSSTGTLTLNANTVAGSDVTINGILNVTGGNLSIILNDDFTLAAAPAALTFNSPGNTFTFTTTAAAGSLATFSGPVTINGNSNWTSSGTLTFNNTLTTSGAGTFTVNSVGTFTTGAASVVNYNSTGNLGVTVSGATNDITLSGIFNVTAANATFLPEDDFTLTATTGVMTFSAPGKTLLFNSGTTSTHNFNGALNVTGGNLSVQAFDDITIAITTGSINYNVPGGSCSFTSTGGADPDLNINGDLTITNGTLSASTFDDIIVGASGSLSYHSSATSTLSANGADGDITINGLMTVTNGNIIMNATSVISSGAASSLLWSSPGTWTMNGTGTNITINGPLTVSNGSVTMSTPVTISLAATSTLTWSSSGSFTMMNTTPAVGSTVTLNGLTNFTNGSWSIDSQGSISTGGASTLNYSAAAPFSMLSHLGNITFNGPVNLNTAAAFSAIATVGSINVNHLVRNTSSGPITMTVGNDFLVGTNTATLPAQIGSAGGLTQIFAGDAITIQASDTTVGATALIGFSSGGQIADIILTSRGPFRIVAQNAQFAGIQSTGKITLTTGQDLVLRASLLTGATGEAFISGSDNVLVTADNVSLFSTQGGALVHIDTTQGKLQATTTNNITLTDHTLIANYGPGNLTLVVDQQSPLPPGVGTGQFNLFSGANLTTNGGDLSIFTATPSQNQVTGLINNATLEEGNQVFGVYFDLSGIDPPPFTIFYKGGVGENSFFELTTASSEMTQQQLDRSIGWAWMSPFVVCYDNDDYTDLDSKLSRRLMLFKRKPFEYPIFFPAIECPSVDTLPVAHDPFRYLFGKL